MRKAKSISLTDEQRAVLLKWSRGRTTPSRLVLRARIVLLAAEGKPNNTIALEVETDENTVGRWRNRFAREGLPGIEKDRPRGGRKPVVRNGLVRQILEMTTRQKPPAATHWTTRTLAKAIGTNPMMVQRVWTANGLKPHRVRTFKVSHDPHFADKVVDVVGLYLNPPEHAVVLSVDEKTQIQALDRTQRGLPMKKGRCGTMTHDYKRNGTTILFAALNTLDGRLIGTCMKRHRHQEWIRFLTLVDQQTPPNLDLHLMVDNYAVHKHLKVQKWLARHKRFHIHFTPTSSSWMNLVERWFRDLTDQRIRRGVFRSVEDLQRALSDYIEHHNAQPHAYVWTAKAQDILDKVKRAKAVLDNL